MQLLEGTFSAPQTAESFEYNDDGNLNGKRSWGTCASDAESRLKAMTNAWTGGSHGRDTTLFDARNRRKTVEWDDGSKWAYGYNERGEVLAAERKWSDGTNVSGQQHGITSITSATAPARR